jgi:integrase/recombinase XerD
MAEPHAPDSAERCDPEGLAALVPRYLHSLGVVGRSPTTVASRAHQLGCFVAWCEERSITRPQEVTRAILERYQSHLYHQRKSNDAPLGVVTQYGRLVAVRLFFRWLAKQNLILINPASELELPQLGERLPKSVLSAAEAELVLALPDLDKRYGVRARAILETLYSTGMRRTELAHLKLHDVDFERGTVTIRQGKGNKDRLVPIGERALAWLKLYLTELRPYLVRGPDHGTLFLLRNGDPATPGALSRIVRDLVQKAKIEKTGACHLFRHTAATLMLENGADIRFIQSMLGHERLQSTQLYTRVSIRKLKEVHTATHPAARLRRQGSGSRDQGSGANHDHGDAPVAGDLDSNGDKDDLDE